jgi:hypothetical protein
MYLWVIGIDCVSFYDFSIAFWNRSHSVVKKIHFIVRIIANKKHPQSQCHNLTRILVYHLLRIFLSWVPCWDVRYVYLMRTMFGSSLPPVVCGCACLLRFWWLIVHSGIQHIFCCVFVLFFFVLCTLCCQILWIVHCWFPLRCSLAFIVARILLPCHLAIIDKA